MSASSSQWVMVAVSASSVGIGLALICLWLMRPRVSLLEARIAHMLPESIATTGRGKTPLLARCGATLGRVLGGSDAVRQRLIRAGCDPDVDAFRSKQALWGLGGLATATCIVIVSGREQSGAGTSAALILFSAVCGVVMCDQQLSAQARRREREMVAEFPTVADMLALAVAAGQGPLGALDHVTQLCSGPLAQELSRALTAARSGTPLADALADVGKRTSVVAISRFVEGVIVALERGTPLADVLRAQAQDARELARGELIESAGHKEVLMMAPVVFLILPTTILFAVFPGVQALNLNL